MHLSALRHIPFLVLFAYSLHGTGLCCDDFEAAMGRHRDPWFNYLLSNPANILTHGVPFLWIDYERQYLYDLLKFGWVALSYGMTYRFGALFFPPARAALFAALFIFYPAHDSTSFWFQAQYLMLTAAFYLLAFYLAARNRLAGAAAMATLASFVSYGSSPWAFGLSLVFLLERQFRRAAALLVPNLIYIAYYAVVTLWLGLGNPRLPAQLDAERLLKQLVIQIAAGTDAVLGPSLWFKLWYSVAGLTLVSAVVGAVIVLLLVRIPSNGEAPARVRWPVWMGVAAVALAGCAMLALTPGYPQAAFGLSNRITIYASFPVAFLLAHLAKRAWSVSALAALLVFSSLGISDHWRAWRGVQDRTIEALRSDAELASGSLGTGTVFVVGHAYSQLGPIAHISFLGQKGVDDAVFELALGARKTFRTVPLTSRFVVEPGALVDPRDGQRYPVAGKVLVYDTQAQRLQRIELDDMPRFIAGLEIPKRHWIQVVEIVWVRELILRWMPQLGYLWR
jgi:hypothetical protein